MVERCGRKRIAASARATVPLRFVFGFTKPFVNGRDGRWLHRGWCASLLSVVERQSFRVMAALVGVPTAFAPWRPPSRRSAAS